MPISPTASPGSADDVRTGLRKAASAERAIGQARFFQAVPGGYGESDRFLGVTVPDQRAVARQFRGLPLAEVAALLRDQYHECRLTSLFILVDHFERGDERTRSEVVRIYLDNLEGVNNWDLVDSSAHPIPAPRRAAAGTRLSRKPGGELRKCTILGTEATSPAGTRRSARAWTCATTRETPRIICSGAHRTKCTRAARAGTPDF
jgi:hypothetical protein